MIKKERDSLLIVSLIIAGLVLFGILLLLTINLFFLKPKSESLLGSLRSGTLFQGFAGEQYDIAITEIFATNPAGLINGDFVSINITLENLGIYEDSSEVIFSETPLGTIERKSISLSPGETKILMYNFTAKVGDRNYVFLAASLNDENLSNNIFNYSTSIIANNDIKGEIQISPYNEGNYIDSISQLQINLSNQGLNSASNINYTLYVMDPEDPLHPQTISDIVPQINSMEEIIIHPLVSLEVNKDYLSLLIINFTGDEYLANNAHSKDIIVRGSGPDLDVMLSNYRGLVENNYLFIGESKEIGIQINNKGNLESGQITFSVYDYDPVCVENQDFENLDCILGLINQETLSSIPGYSSSNYQFNYYGAEEGVFLLKAEAISTQQDTNNNNNYEFIPFTVKRTGTDLIVLISQEQEYREFIVNETNYLTVRVGNLGNVKATNISVSLYLRRWEINDSGSYEFNETLLGLQTLTELGSKKYAPADIPFIIREAGSVSLKVNATSDNEDIDFSTNTDYASLKIVSQEYSYDLEIIDPNDDYNENHLIHGSLAFPIVGRNYTLFAIVENNGRTINNVDLSFYINYTTGVETLIAINQTGKIYSVTPGYSSFTWVPGAPGLYPIRVEAVVNENGQVLREEYSGNLRIYQAENLTINITNSTNSPVKRYIKSTFLIDRPKDIYGMISNEYAIEGQKSLEFVNLNGIELQMIDYYDHNYVAAHNFSVRYNLYLKDLGDTLNIISERYDKIVDEGKEFYYVFANKVLTPSRIYSVNDYSLIVNNQTLSKSGIGDLEGKYAVYYCPSFDFKKPGCNQEWNYMPYVYSQDINLSDVYPTEIISYLGDEYHIPPMKQVYSYQSAYDTAEAIAISKSEGFDGLTTNLGYEDLITGFTLEKQFYGKIRFLEQINISRFKKDNGLLDYYVTIKSKRIGIDTTKLLELNNKMAELTFRGVNMENPTVLQNGDTCPTSVCSKLEYNSGTQTLNVNVNSFSEFTVVDVPLCGNGVCDDSEDCSSCEQDCGTCDDGGDDGGDSGLSGGSSEGTTSYSRTSSCIPNWACTWGDCVNEQQERTCIDKNYCNTTVGKPSDKTRICLAEEQCADQDGDGYGIGENCLGPDIDDTDSSVWEEETPKDSKTFWIYIIAIATIILFLIVITTILIVLINKNRKKYSS